MITFKVGDRVRRIATSYDEHMQVGTIGTVTKANCDGTWISVDHYVRGKEEYPYMSLYFELVAPEEQAMQHKPMKIRIKDEEHSRLVQETLFEMGYGWPNKQVGYTSSPWLTTYEDGRLYCGEEMSVFDSHENEEVELVTTYSFKPVDQEAKRKAAEKEALQKNVAKMQKQLDEMKQKLESL